MRAQLLRFWKAFPHYVIVDIAERRNFDVRHRSVRLDVLLASTPQSNDCDAHPVIRAQNISLCQRAQWLGSCNRGGRFYPSLQKLSPALIHFVSPLTLLSYYPATVIDGQRNAYIAPPHALACNFHHE